jgi:hypothetical protein
LVQTIANIDQTADQTGLTLAGPWLITNGTTVVVYLDAQVNTGNDVIAGSMQLIPINAVRLTSKPSCAGGTATVTATVTAN